MTVLFVTGTGTGVGKTVVTAALAALALAQGRRVAVVKPAQTGVGPDEPGDLAEVERLAGPTTLVEGARYAAPLAPSAAARVAGLPTPDLDACARLITTLSQQHDLVLVEGAGGLLVPFDRSGAGLAQVAQSLGAPAVVVADPALGTLNHTVLTLEAMRARGIACAGVVLGSWPDAPDLACRTNLADLEQLTGEPLAGVLAAGLGELDRTSFVAAARAGLGPRWGGQFDAADFRRTHDPVTGNRSTP